MSLPLIVCLAIVTTVAHGSVATQNCHYEGPTVATTLLTPAPVTAVGTYNLPDIEVISTADARPAIKPERPRDMKRRIIVARIHHRAPVRVARPAMSAEQNRTFRFSWFKRIAGL